MLGGHSITPDSELRWPFESDEFGHYELDRTLMWAADEDCSDIRLEAGKQIIFQRHGRVVRVSKRTLTIYEVERAANAIYAADAVAHLRTKEDWNLAYEPGRSRDKRYRFRVNASLALQEGRDGPALVARTLPTHPVPLDRQNVEPDILNNFRPRNGLIIIAGATGSGKSTLASGMTFHELNDPDSHSTILEYSAPIEHVYDGIRGPTSEITQIEIGRHLTSFSQGIRHAVRSNADIIVVGECRDAETMIAAINAAQADHRVLLTLHGGSIYETFQRAVSLCPMEVRSEMTVALAQAVRLVVNQRLVWSTDGTRTPIREWMVCHQSIRRMLGSTDPKSWPQIMDEMAQARQTDFATSIHRARDEGRISREIALKQLEGLKA